MDNGQNRHLWWNQPAVEWSLIGLGWLLLLTLGVVGFLRHAVLHNQSMAVLDALYLTIQLVSMNSGEVPPPLPWELNVARFGIPALVALSAVRAFALIFRQQAQLMGLRFARRHVIICGLSRKGFHLTDSFRQQDQKVVVVEEDEDNDWIEQCRARGAIVLLGDATDPALLRQAGVERARCVIAVCDDDGVNAEVAVQAQNLVRNRIGEPLLCLAHLVDPQLCALLRAHGTNLSNSPFQLELFNIFERGARLLFQEHPAFRREAIRQPSPPHLLVVGLGRMGESLVVWAARQWWNYYRQDEAIKVEYQPARPRLQVTVLDYQVDWKVAALNVRYPQVIQACDLHPLQMDVRSSEFQRGAFLLGGDGTPPVTIAYICVDNDSLGLQAGLALLQRVPHIPIVVRMAESGGLARLLEGDGNHFRNLSAFGLLNHTCTPDLLLSTPREALARAIHEDFVLQERAAGRYVADRPSLQDWEKLDEQYRQVNYRRVDRLEAELRLIHRGIVPLRDWDAPSQVFSPSEVEKMARLEHNLWCEEKNNQGWRYDSQKDNGQKTSPNLTAWENLPSSEQEHKRSMVIAIPRLLARCGFQVVQEEID